VEKGAKEEKKSDGESKEHQHMLHTEYAFVYVKEEVGKDGKSV